MVCDPIAINFVQVANVICAQANLAFTLSGTGNECSNPPNVGYAVKARPISG